MDISIIISGVIGIISTIIAGVLTYISTKRSSKDLKLNNLLEEQYSKIVAPIHKALCFSNEKDIDNMVNDIVDKYYYLLPDNFLSRFLDGSSKKTNSETFEAYIENLYIVLRKKLGYSKIQSKDATSKIGKFYDSIMSIFDVILLVWWVITVLAMLFLCIVVWFIEGTPLQKWIIFSMAVGTILFFTHFVFYTSRKENI